VARQGLAGHGLDLRRDLRVKPVYIGEEDQGVGTRHGVDPGGKAEPGLAGRHRVVLVDHGHRAEA